MFCFRNKQSTNIIDTVVYVPNSQELCVCGGVCVCLCVCTCEEKVQTRKSVWDKKWMSSMTPLREFSVYRLWSPADHEMELSLINS